MKIWGMGIPHIKITVTSLPCIPFNYIDYYFIFLGIENVDKLITKTTLRCLYLMRYSKE